MLFQDTIEKPKGISGDFIIKGVIHIIDNDKNFEVLHEEFTYTGLESNGYFLSQSDIDIHLEHELPLFDWGTEVEVGWCYAILYRFGTTSTKEWTSCGYEHDIEIDCKEFHMIPVDESANKFYLQDYFQLEE